MEGSQGLGIFLGFIFGMLIGMLFMGIPMSAQERDYKTLGIESGAAYYKLDAKTGLSTYVWKHLEKVEK